MKMKSPNQTTVREFLLRGFSASNEMSFFIFIILLLVYILTITANILIITIVKAEPRLHRPMYFFINGFSFLEICYMSVTVPRLLKSLITKQQWISSAECETQFYFHFSFGVTENAFLTVMAYDRYVAICKPLHYSTIMSSTTCAMLLMGSWMCGFIVLIVPCVQISTLVFCGPNVIDHYYCDFAPLVKLSCSDTSHIETFFFVLAMFTILGCFILIITSYVCIIHTITMFPTASGRRKAFSTCSSHLLVVVLFYGSTGFMFLRPNAGNFLNLNKIISVVPSIVTPLVNPVIYTLRNQEVKEAAKNIMHRIRNFQID